MNLVVLHSLVRKRADLVQVLEVMYAPEPDASRWIGNVLQALQAILVSELGAGMGIIAHTPGFANPALVAAGVSRGLGTSFTLAAIERLPPDELRTSFYPGARFATHRDTEPMLSSATVSAMRYSRKLAGWYDTLGIFAYPEPGMISVIGAGFDRGQTVSPLDRRRVVQIAEHLDSALRLRVRPEVAVAAVIAPDGKICDLADRALASEGRAWFGARVTAIDALRTRRGRVRADVDPWWALFAGRYSIVPVEDSDGKRHYLLLHNGPTVEEHGRFTLREIDAVRMAARGCTGKTIAYDLGISASTLSETLQRAAHKVGLRSRHELLRVASALFGVSSMTLDLSRLTLAEREILELLRRGFSNEGIAQRRARSLNTVRNQVAALLRKTGAPSRKSLALAR